MPALCALILSISLLVAADEPRKTEYQIPEEAAKEQTKGKAVDAVVISLWVFGGLILFFTATMSFGVGYIMVRSGKDFSDPNYQRIFCMVNVLGLGTFLVVAGYSAA